MTKLQFLLCSSRQVSRAAFRERALGDLVPRLLRLDPQRLTLHLSLDRVPRLSLIPYQRQPLALVSVETDQRPRAWTLPLRRFGSVSGYAVEQSIPRDYQRDWPDGTQSPGVGLLTLFRRRGDLSQQRFLEAWHGAHTPLSLEIHPLWRYVRNRVVAPVVEGSPVIDGIVEEHFREPADLLDPRRFFGGAGPMLTNIGRVALDIGRFIALTSLRMFLVSEHPLRS